MTTLNTTSGGSTTGREEFSGEVYEWIIHTLTAFICLCGLVGNGKVIWILRLCTQRRYFVIYILNLAIADFGTLVALLIRETSLPFHKPQTLTLSILYSLFFFTHSASLYLLTAISMERCLSVLSPIWYQRHRTGYASTSVSFLLWAFAGLLSGGLLLFCTVVSFETYKMAVSVICGVNVLIFTPLMVASTLTLFTKIYCYSQGHPLPRVYSAILVTLLCFIIFAIPLSAVHIILIYSKHYSRAALEISVLSASFNSSINPLIYYYIGRDGNNWCKESLKAVLQRVFKEDTDSRTTGSLV
ncbi:PREDICTED: mas-related G-protein coupled receptor member H-like [Gekko japonicus]|uniref:Mas-related G-protein coupled receptor member H-like n=1 Tax=Gekko japonicus TaxID=146911 RepID=A0ABM1LD43_GEKJA|nr:PREDICTED: mas-related G-protein coupled receptor member H-like [Gekko japonicus]